MKKTSNIINTKKTYYVHLYKVVNTFADNTTTVKYYFNDGTECLSQTFINKQLNEEYITEDDIKVARAYSVSKFLKSASKKSRTATQTELLTERLKNEWMSNWQIQQFLKSSSGDRVMRYIRSNPPIGYIMESRKKDVPAGYNKCLEYKLVKVD